MKIITKGIVPKETVAEFTCGNCNTVVEVTKGEVEIHDSQSESFYYWKCPVCGKDNYEPVTSVIWKPPVECSEDVPGGLAAGARYGIPMKGRR